MLCTVIKLLSSSMDRVNTKADGNVQNLLHHLEVVLHSNFASSNIHDLCSTEYNPTFVCGISARKCNVLFHLWLSLYRVSKEV